MPSGGNVKSQTDLKAFDLNTADGLTVHVHLTGLRMTYEITVMTYEITVITYAVTIMT